jgi:hypothetical protein
MMKQLVLVGALAGSLVASPTFAQSKKEGAAQAGHAAPKQQPATASAPNAPTGEVALGSVHLPKAVKADGKTLPAGTYVVRVTTQTATPEAKGQTPTLERWLEFTQKGQVKGREVVTIVPQAEIGQVQKDAPPKANGSKFETLKGGDYTRLWINRGGNHYLVHFPNA